MEGSSKKIGEINLISILNKILPQAHTELDLDMLGVIRKLVKYVILSSIGRK
jgi:hypothetical protein